MHEPLLEFNVITAESCWQVSLVASGRCRKGLKAEGRQNWGDTGGVEENWGGWAWQKQMSCREISLEDSVSVFFFSPKFKLQQHETSERLRVACTTYGVWCHMRGCYRIRFLVVGLGSLCVLAIRNAIVYKQNLQQTCFPSVSFSVIFSWGLGSTRRVFAHEVGVACLQKLQNTCLYMLLC